MITAQSFLVQRSIKNDTANAQFILIAFASAFYPRIIEALGAPAPVNFLHFLLVPATCFMVIFGSRVKDSKQMSIVQALLGGLLILFAISVSSALINGAGFINIILGLMISAEPFILLAALLSISFSPKGLKNFRNWLLSFGLIHLILAFGQKIGIETGALAHTVMTRADNVQGVFYLSFGGHVVGASVALAFGLYYFFAVKAPPLLRGSILGAVCMHILFADAKQVIFVGGLSWIVLILSKVNNIKVALRYIAAASLLGFGLYWCIYNIEAFAAYRTWIRPHIYTLDGDATVLKMVPFHIIPRHYDSFFNWLLGLGPGHTIGRIGGWMIQDYWSLVGPLGATKHPVSTEVWNAWNGHYLDSSIFSPLWGWAGIWGDLGLLGVASYGFLWMIVWRQVCKDDISKFLMLTIVVNGFIFTLMEEPGFLLTSIMLIGVHWHSLRHRELGL